MLTFIYQIPGQVRLDTIEFPIDVPGGKDTSECIRTFFRDTFGVLPDIDGGKLDVLEVCGTPGRMVELCVGEEVFAVVVRTA